MSISIGSPLLDDELTTTADWVECAALIDKKKCYSLRDLNKTLKQTGSVDAIDFRPPNASPEVGEEMMIEGCVDSVERELQRRFRECGGADNYPFIIENSVLEVSKDPSKYTYTFMLLLSYLVQKGHKVVRWDINPRERFEHISGLAIQNYLGGEERNAAYAVFGFPRRVMPSNFCQAVTELCKRMGEGKASNESPEDHRKKDARLDVVAWRNFHDKRPGKLITFAQCATGRNWIDKAGELPQPHKWCGRYLKELPLVDPVRAFCVPHRINDHYRRRDAALDGDLLLERCRIAGLAGKTADDEVVGWVSKVLGELDKR